MGTTGKPLVHVLPLLVVTLSLTGCHSMGSGPQMPEEKVVKARQEIANYRENVTLLVPRIKEKFRGKESEDDYIKARDLYDHAMAENNSWVLSLKLGIENNEDLASSSAFQDKAKAAGDAADTFVKYGKQQSQGRSLVLFPVEAFIRALFENGIVIWNTNRAKERADRLDQAASTEKALKWPRWEEVK